MLRHRFFTLIMLLTVGIFYTGTVLAAGEDCCVSTRDGEEVGCRISTSCDETPTIGEMQVDNSQQGQPGVTCQTVQISGRADRTLLCTRQTMVRERPASCVATPICGEILRDFDNCEALPVSGGSSSACAQNSRCFVLTAEGGTSCYSKQDRSVCSKITDASLCGPASDRSVRGAQLCRWLEGSEGGRCVGVGEAEAAGRFVSTTSGILTQCAIQGTCRSIRDLEDLAFKVVRLFFSIFGSVSFAFFIYGGVVMIASFGNTDRFSKGKAILTAAVTGIIISFSAYLLIGYFLTLLGIEGNFRGGIGVSFLPSVWL